MSTQKSLKLCRTTNEETVQLNTYQNALLALSQNTPVRIIDDNSKKKRRYTRSQDLSELAVNKYDANGRGITFKDLLKKELACHKKQAQETLKRCLQNETLFTVANHKPQEYFPTCLKSKILKDRISKNASVRVTEVGCNCNGACKDGTTTSTDTIAIQSLEGYVLPLLPSAPLHIHKLQFKLKITPECYAELGPSMDEGNKGKQHVEVIGKVRVLYYFYSNGRVMVFIESSNNPFRLEDEIDLSRLIAFFGQVRDRLITFLADKHQRIVPDIMEWELTQCDINKDVNVSHLLHATGLKLQVKHYDHLFRIYIKSMGKDTVWRVEESKSPIDVIRNIFNPTEKLEYEITELNMKLDRILTIVTGRYGYDFSNKGSAGSQI
jgi:hypothetical protein